jgi:hypothetical protein
MDTPNSEVARTTFPGLEAEYAALQGQRAARRAATVAAQGLEWKYADAEEGLFQTLKQPQALAEAAAQRIATAPPLSPAAALAYPDDVQHLTGIREALPEDASAEQR